MYERWDDGVDGDAAVDEEGDDVLSSDDPWSNNDFPFSKFLLQISSWRGVWCLEVSAYVYS
jgi:hypothetical protein